MKNKISVSFVIPVFNEEKRIDVAFKALKKASLPAGLFLKEVIFVNDGSTDNTVRKIEVFAKKAKLTAKIILLTYSENRGKGAALKEGMLKANSDYTLFFDADMSTPISEIAKFKPFMEKGIEAIIGTRKNGHSTVTKHQPVLRRTLGKGFTKITQLVLSIENTDFTCGFKAFANNAKNAVFTDSMIAGWGYDAEILYLTNKYGFSMKEVPVTWANDERTKVRLVSAVTKTFKELGTIVWIHRIQPKLAGIAPSPLITRHNLIK
jgi:dolichyl-phosphate beta-glucosyltransferase